MVKLHTHVLQHRDDHRGADSLCLSCADTEQGYSVVNNKNNDILTGRKIGFLECDADFVSFVDDDDETLLTKPQLVELLDLDAPAAFTNSLVVGGTHVTLQVAKSLTSWTLESEKRGYIRPHQTIVYKQTVAKLLLAESERLIVKQGWSPNSIDHVMRLLASVSLGWSYLPSVTYKWYRNPDGQHLKRPLENNIIRKFFLG